MQPRPRADTSRLLFPSLRFCMVSPRSRNFCLPSGYRKPNRSFLRNCAQGDLTIFSLEPLMLHNDNMTSIPRSVCICFLGSIIAVVVPVFAQSGPAAQPAERPAPPTRDPKTVGYVAAKELPDGSNPPENADGNFILGPTHDLLAALPAQDSIPKG